MALAREHHPRVVVFDGDRDVGERLVVAQPHVERRAVALDEVLFEVERLDLALRDDRLDRLDAVGHLADPLPRVARAGLEVRAHAGAQRLRLPDVENIALRVAEEVDAGLLRHALQLALDAVRGHWSQRIDRLVLGGVRLLCVILLVFFASSATAWAGGPAMMVGAAEDVGRQQDYAFAKSEMDMARLAGLDSIRLTQIWTTGDVKLGPNDQIELGNAIKAAQFTGLRVVLSLYPLGSSVTPLTEQDRADFAAYVVDVAGRYPVVHDFVIGNEPNLNRFWMPQFNDDGSDAAAPAYEQLLATTYDALRLVRPRATIYGGALAPRGVDKPNTGRDTHSPTAFIADLGAAYRASGRTLPIMDALAFHPYPETSATGPGLAHPNGTSIGIADYAKLVSLLGSAFDGTAQRGSSLPILYAEFGVETQVPAAKAALYSGTEPTTTKPVDEATQARMYAQAMQLSFCQPTVLGLMLFHLQDEPVMSAWQSGEYYVDGSPKTSLPAVRGAAASVHRGVAAACPGLQLTPKLVIKVGKPDKRGVKVFLTCSLDCNYTVSVDSRSLTGTATGRLTATIVFRGKLPPGLHRAAATGRVPLNTGPAGTASRSFRSR